MDSFASHKTHSKLAYLTETKMLADEIKRVYGIAIRLFFH